MPIMYPNYDTYKIDYQDLIDTLRKQISENIFSSKQVLELYLKKWIELLEEEDKNSTAEFMKPNTIGYNEMFQQVDEFNDQNLYLNVKINNLINSIKEQEKTDMALPVVKIPHNKFFSENSGYYWTRPSDDSVSKKSDPIIIINFPVGRCRCLVVDGNHRLKEWEKNKKDVDAIFIEVSELDQAAHIFLTTFDVAFFFFKKDIEKLADAKRNSQIEDVELLNQSFLQKLI